MEETDPAGSQSRCARYMWSNNDFTAEAIAVMAGARYNASLLSAEAACMGSSCATSAGGQSFVSDLEPGLEGLLLFS